MKLEFWETFWSDTERSSYMWVVLKWLHGVLLLQLSSIFYNYSAPQREHCHNCLNFCPGFDRQSLCSCLLTTRLRPLLLTVLFSSQFLPSLLSLHCLFLSSKDKLWRPGKSAPQKMSMTDTVNEREREREREINLGWDAWTHINCCMASNAAACKNVLSVSLSSNCMWFHWPVSKYDGWESDRTWLRRCHVQMLLDWCLWSRLKPDCWLIYFLATWSSVMIVIRSNCHWSTSDLGVSQSPLLYMY